MTDQSIAQIAAGLTKAQREAVASLSDEWQAGPHLADETIECLRDLRSMALVERDFGDMAPVERRDSSAGIAVRVSACWFFRLTGLGLAIRARAASLSDHGEGV